MGGDPLKGGAPPAPEAGPETQGQGAALWALGSGWHLLGTGTRVPIHSFPLSGLGTPLVGRAAPRMRKQGPERYVACHFSCDKRHVILSYFSDMGAISSVETRETRYREIKSLTHGQITRRFPARCITLKAGLDQPTSWCKIAPELGLPESSEQSRLA